MPKSTYSVQITPALNIKLAEIKLEMRKKGIKTTRTELTAFAIATLDKEAFMTWKKES